MSQHSTSASHAALGVPVAVPHIEKALKRLWEDDQTSTKASLVNFAILSEDTTAIERNTEWIRRITSENACRAILIDADFDESLEPDIKAWVTAHHHLQGNTHSVSSEQIAFSLRGRMIGRMRNVIFAHLFSDLPLIFWWQGRLSTSVAFEPNFYNQIDRLFVDSGAWGDASAIAEELAILERLVDERGDRIVINDLTWTRILPFRKAIVSRFDDPRMSARLGGLNELTITGNTKRPGALLCFAAWIAESLDWKLKARTAKGFEFLDNRKTPQHIVFVDAENGEQIDRIEWSGSDGGIQLSFTDDHRNYLGMKTELGGISDRNLVPAGKTDCPDLVMTQLARATRDELYRGVLPIFRQLAVAMA